MNKVTNFSEISGLDGLDKSFEVASIVYFANQEKKFRSFLMQQCLFNSSSKYCNHLNEQMV